MPRKRKAARVFVEQGEPKTPGARRRWLTARYNAEIAAGNLPLRIPRSDVTALTAAVNALGANRPAILAYQRRQEAGSAA